MTRNLSISWCIPLLFAAHGVPFWLLTLGFGHNDMFWYRLIEWLGRNSLVGTTVHDPAQLPSASGGGRASRRLGRPEELRRHNLGEGCVLGVGLTASADDAHLKGAYGVFAAKARDVDRSTPRDGQHRRLGVDAECVQTLFPLITVVLCFLHGS